MLFLIFLLLFRLLWFFKWRMMLTRADMFQAGLCLDLFHLQCATIKTDELLTLQMSLKILPQDSPLPYMFRYGLYASYDPFTSNKKNPTDDLTFL